MKTIAFLGFTSCRLLLATSLALALVLPVQAADLPEDKPVRLVVPAAPGGPTDILARTTGLFLGRINGRKYVVENRAGASGLIGAAFVSQAQADGQTLLLAGAGSFLLAREPDSPKIDLMSDLALIGVIAGSPILFVTDTRQGATSLERMVQDSLRHRKPLRWGSAGTATFGYFLGNAIFQRAGAGETIHAPYKGGSQILLDVVGGNLDIGVATVSGAQPLIQSGQIQGIAISSPVRSPFLPNTPTFKELGFGDLTFLTWFALLAPKNTPPTVLNALRRDLSLIRKDPEFIEALAAAAFQVSSVETQRTQQFIGAEMKHWRLLQGAHSGNSPSGVNPRP